MRDDGFRVLDGAAMVVGAAVASVHMRAPVALAEGMGWGMVWITFAGVALTAAGPILLLVARYGRRRQGHPLLGDRLWGLLGAPWIVSAFLRSPGIGPVDARDGIGLYASVLTMTLGAASLVALAVLWKTWVLTPPGARDADGPVPWTQKMGLALAISWPLQWGFLLVVLDSEGRPPAP